MSKNVEATGKRITSYDEWRTSLSELPEGTYFRVPFLESSASSNTEYPYFDIHCVVFPNVLAPQRQLTAEQYAKAAKLEAAHYERHRAWLSRLNVPVIAAVINYDMTTFAIKSVIDDSEPLVVNRTTFVNDVIHQQFRSQRTTSLTIRQGDQVSRYSAWHRVALSLESYVFEVNYVELREGNPVAIIERTQVTRGDLNKNFFNFMTRGFTQGMVVLQVAERLAAKCFLTVYEKDMSRLLVVELNREVLEMAKPLSKERAELSDRFETQEQLPRKWAQGKASQVLYDKYGDLRERMLKATNYTEYSNSEYQAWLQSL